MMKLETKAKGCELARSYSLYNAILSVLPSSEAIA